jgi:tRNA threonylcarbamoyladenosine biosynthesis protein TsaB
MRHLMNSKETLLAIDTSTELASVALAKGETIYYAEKEQIREHAKYLLPMVEELLTQASLQLHDLDGIVVGCGPGSFTGLRIACSVVKGLAYPHSIPVYAVSGLAAIAETIFKGEPRDDIPVLSVIDARMHEIYWDCYTSGGHHSEAKVTPADAVQLSTDLPFILAGVGVETYFSALPDAIQQQCLRVQTVFPDAKSMIRLVRAGRISPQRAEDILPVYIRNQVVQGV